MADKRNVKRPEWPKGTPVIESKTPIKAEDVAVGSKKPAASAAAPDLSEELADRIQRRIGCSKGEKSEIQAIIYDGIRAMQDRFERQRKKIHNLDKQLGQRKPGRPRKKK